jgi:acetylornithine deacetylase/succinyl-diaminopimelate desuccinylase-like protein
VRGLAQFFLCCATFAAAVSAVAQQQSRHVASYVSGQAAGATTTFASDRIPPEKMRAYAELALRWEREYLRINTTNPPGNELAAARWFKQIFDAEAIENQVFEYRPGRGNIIARLPAGGSAQTSKARPIILLNHMDVVTSDAARWKYPPFSGEEADGYIWGRGAQDMKSDGIAELMVMVMLKRERVPLTRDVIFLGTSDEEVDDTGSQWMIDNQRELLGNAEYLITEGGENLLEDGKAKFIGVDAAEKSPFWLHVVAKGRPGHGSRPIPESAANHLIRALNKLANYKTELKLLPAVEQFMTAMAQYQTGERAHCYRNIRTAIHEATCAQLISNDESLNYMFRNTISITMLGGSQQTNVIPGEAWANVDVRLLPREDPQQFLALIRKVTSEPGVTVEMQQKQFRVANSSPLDTPLFAAIKKASARYFDGAPVVPRLTSGYDENQMFRPLGMVAYGFSPYLATAEEGSTEHGDNERIRVEEIRRGFRVLYDVVGEVAAK